MDKDAVLQFVKKNAFALSCGVVAIVAAVLLFYPLGGWVEALREKATASAGHAPTLDGFERPRQFPNVNPSQTAPTSLTSFPNHDQVEAGKAAVDQLVKESQRTMDVLVALNDHTSQILVKRLLPKPESDTLKFQFADIYRRVLSTDPTVSGLGSPTIPPPVQANPKRTDPMVRDEQLSRESALNLCNDVLRAGAPADAKLIDARKAWLYQNDFQPQFVLVNGKATNQGEVMARFNDAAKLVPDELSAEIARTRKVYLERDAFGYYSTFAPGAATGNPDMNAIWWAQQSLWVQSDIAHAVAEVNGDPNKGGVAESPIKRILKLDLSGTGGMYRNPGGTAGAGPGVATDIQPQPLTYDVSTTGRTSSAMYDVVPFWLTIDVDANRVNEVLTGLTAKRLIYISNQNLYTIDPAALAAQGYQYGSGPVVRLTLAGEELFLRKWSVELMPDPVKALLGLIAGTPGEGAVPGGMQMPPGSGFPPGGMSGMPPRMPPTE